MEQAVTKAQERGEAAKGVCPPADPFWARLMLPRMADLVFLVIFCALVFTPWPTRMLSDAGTGWHIRNGEHILATHAVPHVDYFSYTAAGKAWFAWEWLYDIAIAGIHAIAGLNGTVVFTALIIALTFALLFRTAAALSENIFVSAALTFLTAACSSIHFLVRPHVLTWLFTLAWMVALRAIQEGRSRALYWLPPMMLVWANVHGGFVIGLVLAGIFSLANFWTYLTVSCPKKRRASGGLARRFAGATVISALVTLANPYRVKLWAHLHEYLGSPFLMNTILEFQSPDFHWLEMKFFAALLLITVISLALQAGKIRALDLMLVMFSIYAGLYAARNVPLSAIILTLTVAPIAARALSELSKKQELNLTVRRYFVLLDSLNLRMSIVEGRLIGWALPVVVVIAVSVTAIHGGRIGSIQAMNASFDENRLPVKAVNYVAASGVRTQMFAPDDWGGYLTYRMYPDFKVYIDDRHDFFGEPFVREYMQAANAGPKWGAVLDRYSVNRVLIRADSPLAAVLEVAPGWKLVYRDSQACIFMRSELK